MNYKRSNKYDMEFLKTNMMGPNCLKIIEELTNKMEITPNMKILDLGCGTGLTSIYLAKEFGATVFATDLWISPSDNFDRFKKFNLEEKIIPIHAEAHDLPFAHHYFDAIISIDAYNYFGCESGYLEKHILPLVKKNGLIGIAVPGLKNEFTNGVPKELIPFWQENMNFYSLKWWKNLWSKSRDIELKEVFSLQCHKEAWQDWLSCNNEYAISDRKMIEVENGKYFDTIALIAVSK